MIMGSKIKRIYTGLPKHLSNEVIWVERKYRINDLSHQPGGFDIVLEYKSGNVLGYDWIKKPSSYIQQILKNDLSNEEANAFEDFNDDKQLEIAKTLVRVAYARDYQDKTLYDSAEFQQIWNAAESRITLKKALQAFESTNHKLKLSDDLALVRNFSNFRKASNIRQISYFTSDIGIVTLKFDSSFDISTGCIEEGDEWLPGDILTQLPASILIGLGLNSYSPLNQNANNISLIVDSVIENTFEQIISEISTPSVIYSTSIGGTKKAIKNKPSTMKCIINKHGISIIHPNGWCFTIGGNTDEWVFS